MAGPTLAERLGHPGDAPLLVITADGLGASHAASAAGLDALRRGLASSAGLQVPAPWARWVAAEQRGEDVGVQLCVTSPHAVHRFGPITHAPSLVDGAGAFPRTPGDVGDHADADELRRELRAQIDRAIGWGLDVTHLSVLDDVLWLRPELSDVVLEAASTARLPVRLPPAPIERGLGYPLRSLADGEGLLGPDRVLRAASGRSARDLLEAVLAEPRPGVTELVVTPSLDTPEQEALRLADELEPGTEAIDQLDDHALVTTDGAVAAALAAAGIRTVGWRAIRDAQRA